ncbi:hypothetical protein LIER_31583 [Lithospermum erythrorhizon]|uniref:Reverse transcriptase n=1 Tax=Lithospermum erythrorhizon TaxID=34254 RepID=A0AAV3RUZ7_LITER
MLVKSKKRGHHLENLKETFEQLRVSKLRINPEKCSFGVISGKFLGVKGHQFRAGDLVLKLYSASHPKDVNKLSLKWEAPYLLSRFLGLNTYEFEEMDGKPVPRTWHASKLRKFYG